MNISPVLDRILVAPPTEREELSPGGIYIPADKRGDNLQRGVVLAAGPGKTNRAGLLEPVPCQAGDTIVYEGGHVTMLHGERIVVLTTENVIGVMRSS